jgi:hypothetical protein
MISFYVVVSTYELIYACMKERKKKRDPCERVVNSIHVSGLA